MKKLYFTILSLFTAAIAWAQSPIITAIVDGDCMGGSPKFIEIYADGSVDFSKYTLEKQSNNNTEWSNPQDLSSLGTLTNTFAYIVKAEDLTIFKTEFPSATSHILSKSSTVDNNGNDRIRLIETTTSKVIDQYGETDKNGTDQAWEYTDSYAKRKNGSQANAGTFNTENWLFGGVKAFDGKGKCQESEIFETIMSGIGTYNTTLNIKENSLSNFGIYPNPVNNGIVKISSRQSGIINIRIYDVLGKEVLRQSNKTNQINVSDLRSGLYLIKISQNRTSATKKLIIN